MRPVAVDGVVERLPDREVLDPLGVDGQPVGARGGRACSVLEAYGDTPATLATSEAGTPFQRQRGLVGAGVGDDAVGAAPRRSGRSSTRTCPGTGGGSGRWPASQCSLRSITSSHADLVLRDLVRARTRTAGCQGRRRCPCRPAAGRWPAATAANGRSQCGLANSNLSVVASGVVSPGGSEVLLALKSHFVSYCGRVGEPLLHVGRAAGQVGVERAGDAVGDLLGGDRAAVLELQPVLDLVFPDLAVVVDVRARRLGEVADEGHVALAVVLPVVRVAGVERRVHQAREGVDPLRVQVGDLASGG